MGLVSLLDRNENRRDFYFDMFGAINEVTRALAEIGDRRAVEPLISLLNDKERTPSNRQGWFARGEAALALGELGDPRALQPLRTALDDEHDLVRNLAASALRKLEDGTGLQDAAVPPWRWSSHHV